MQIEEYNEQYLNLNEFIQVYNIDMVLNNTLPEELSFDMVNYEELFAAAVEDITSAPSNYINEDDLKNMTPDELQEIIDEHADDIVFNQVYQYYIISDHDADLFKKYTNYPLFYNECIDAYLIGITYYGMSWSFFFTTAERPQYMRNEKFDKILSK